MTLTLTGNEKIIALIVYVSVVLFAGWVAYAAIIGFYGPANLTAPVVAILATVSALKIVLIAAGTFVIGKA